ncbi:MAG: hypothetical protein NZ902_02315 [Acidilobaceae archaeon]|nr:hypothetical protein [Acidilobaceae archaeon]MCX8165653.1 hypothetical protein [Acidilobaceae archaeon]MDW7974078.1 hypothetical protein [Sulfolobales archaeon]
MRAREAAELVLKAAEPVRGGSPSYSPYHVLQALRLASSATVGRIRLSQALGIGEASAKTLIARLKELGLAEASPEGVKASEKGEEVLRAIEGSVEFSQVSLPFEGWESAVVATIREVPPPRDLVKVYTIRDKIVREGCEKVIVGGREGGETFYPGLPDDVKALIDAGLTSKREGTLIIVPESCREHLIAASLRLLSISIESRL